MIIVISANGLIPNELQMLNNLFQKGLEHFHFRKYGLSDDQALEYLEQIDPSYVGRVVLHSHRHLANDLKIERLHFNTSDRIANKHMDLERKYQLSTSTHSIQEFNALDKVWNYAFLSPLFQSISKPGYGRFESVFTEIKYKRNDSVALIGLGGIDYQNMESVFEIGSDGVALLGSLWNQADPGNYFLACKRKASIWNTIKTDGQKTQ
ncbi:thiamine phosphate synthase [Sphingobacterium cellulitidis]|uniref:Thiamine phosphate synthase n=1 Tax=Sphingobacterium cellulitidis TaxID=1768011 RepID=A0A8H9FXL9_9SPHI|nr:thiamine phosphate synthase [Sphingobacterium soli]MBA8987042.1 thiamine-phosphate pyrophosphorylase [Sphingobacterium soli]GGE15899.1 thiamine phosphate synthase [Sphingobacterium soli]